MKMRVTVVAEYDITDDLAERQRIYGATDPIECAKVDQENPVEDLLEVTEIVSHEVRPILSGAEDTADGPQGTYTLRIDGMNFDQAMALLRRLHGEGCKAEYV